MKRLVNENGSNVSQVDTERYPLRRQHSWHAFHRWTSWRIWTRGLIAGFAPYLRQSGNSVSGIAWVRLRRQAAIFFASVLSKTPCRTSTAVWKEGSATPNTHSLRYWPDTVASLSAWIGLGERPRQIATIAEARWELGCCAAHARGLQSQKAKRLFQLGY